MDIFAPVRETLLILGVAGALYIGVMLVLRPWQIANRDDSAPIWKFALLGFGYKLRRHEGLAAISWALLISSSVVAWGYHRHTTMEMVLDPAYAALAISLDSATETVDVAIGIEDWAGCSVEQTAGDGSLPRCTLQRIDGRTVLRLHGFDLTCEVTCPHDGGWHRSWEYSRGPLPAGATPIPEGDDL